jgi:hypothetical protein
MHFHEAGKEKYQIIEKSKCLGYGRQMDYQMHYIYRTTVHTKKGVDGPLEKRRRGVFVFSAAI